MIEVGLIGFGLAGRAFHAPVIRAVPGLHLAAILQRRGNEAAEKYPDVRIVRSLDELLAIQEIRLVVIATPNDTHYPFARQCLAARRDVVVDKPFATTLEEAKLLVQFAKDAGRLLTVYQNRRYLGDFETLRRLLTDGALGRVVTFESHFDRYRPALKAGAWREQPHAGSGVWFDLGPHLLDQALVLFGIPRAIAADIRIERDGATVDDAFEVTLHYLNMRALLRATLLAASPGPTFAVHGTGGSFVKHGHDPQEEALKSGRTPEEANWDSEPPERYGTLTTPDGTRTIPTTPSSFVHYYENIRDAILGKAALAVTPAHALDVMRGLELAVASSQQRCVQPWIGNGP
jgi:predicted dehydrogenase